MSTDTLANVFGVKPLEETTAVTRVVEPTEIVQLNEQPSVTSEQDFERARQATIMALDTGQKALEQILDVAKSSEHPRAYEVVSTMITTVTHAAETLMKLQKQRQEIVVPEEHNDNRNITNNIMVMSTTDMLRQIRAEMNK